MTNKQRRWYCRACGAAGWSKDGTSPPHNRPEGLSCSASGQVSERIAQKRLAQEIREQEKAR